MWALLNGKSGRLSGRAVSITPQAVEKTDNTSVPFRGFEEKRPVRYP
jgi:hypothetical protein